MAEPAGGDGNGNGYNAPIPAHEATYEVLRRGKKLGEIVASLTRDDNGVWFYDTETVATAFAARVLRVSAEESAHFTWNGNRLHTLTYRQVTRTPLRTEFLQYRTSRDEDIAQVQTHEGDFEIELTPGLVDPLSLRLQLAAYLQDPEQRRKAHVFDLIDDDEIEEQRFVYSGRDRVSVPAGCFDAIRVRRDNREESSRDYDSWHAESFYWMPLRVLQKRHGRDELDIRLIDTDLALEPEDCS